MPIHRGVACWVSSADQEKIEAARTKLLPIVLPKIARPRVTPATVLRTLCRKVATHCPAKVSLKPCGTVATLYHRSARNAETARTIRSRHHFPIRLLGPAIR